MIGIDEFVLHAPRPQIGCHTLCYGDCRLESTECCFEALKDP
jgi:hypothetical protein